MLNASSTVLFYQILGNLAIHDRGIYRVSAQIFVESKLAVVEKHGSR